MKISNRKHKLHSKADKKNKHKKKNHKKLIQQQEQILGLGPKIINSVIGSLHNNDEMRVRKIVEGLDEYDVARLLETLSVYDRNKLIAVLGDKIDPDVFPELNEVVQEQIIDSLDDDQIVNIVNELDSDEAVEILENMDDDDQENIIKRLNPELKHQVKTSLAYPEDSAGRVMSRDFVSMPEDWSVKEAKEFLIKDEDLPEDFYTVFITDDKYRPTGEITLDKLLRAKASYKLRDIMDGEIVPINVETDQEEVAHMFREYGWMSAMVVDSKRRLIGVINIDDVVHIIHEEANEDMMHLAGTEEGDVYRSVFSIFRSRAMWLVVNMFATIVAASVVSGFQDVIAEVTTLAVLMPIVASMGGTTGNQTLAVVVRALATKELTSRNTLKMIAKEFAVGVLNGSFFATMVAGIVAVWFPDKHIISMIIAVAMLCNLTIASLAGILIPLTLNKLKADPAIASGVFLIAITDSSGFFIFLGLAKLFLL